MQNCLEMNRGAVTRPDHHHDHSRWTGSPVYRSDVYLYKWGYVYLKSDCDSTYFKEGCMNVPHESVIYTWLRRICKFCVSDDVCIFGYPVILYVELEVDFDREDRFAREGSTVDYRAAAHARQRHPESRRCVAAGGVTNMAAGGPRTRSAPSRSQCLSALPYVRFSFRELVSRRCLPPAQSCEPSSSRPTSWEAERERGKEKDTESLSAWLFSARSFGDLTQPRQALQETWPRVRAR